MNYLIGISLLFGITIISLYIWMFVVRPFEMMTLAKKHGFTYKWLEVVKISWYTYEIRKNILKNNKQKLLIYDTSYDPVNPRYPSRRTIILIDKRRYELNDFLFGYGQIPQIERFILKHESLGS